MDALVIGRSRMNVIMLCAWRLWSDERYYGLVMNSLVIGRSRT